jgi:RND superfamily putative drug exporter
MDQKTRFKLIIGFWILFIVISVQARSLLTESIEGSEETTELDTESAKGSQLVKDRFNLTGDELSHTVIISLRELNQEITSSKWRNFTLYLSQYLLNSLLDLEYDQVFSEPIMLSYGYFDNAAAMVSENRLYGMINVISNTLTLGDESSIEDFTEHVHTIRDLLGDVDAFYDYVGAVNTTKLPSISDAKTAKLILTGNIANFVDLIEVAETTFDESELIAVLVIIVILALVFKSPMGIFLPIISMIGALFPTYLLTFILGELGVFTVNDFLPSMIAMIGIAVAVDYNLFSMVRFREEYRKRKAQHELDGTWTKETRRHTQVLSAKIMNATAGNAVMFSGFTVMTGFGAMLVLGSEFTLGMALSVSIVVTFSILTARTLTPAILSLFGDYLDWPNFMSGARRDIDAQKTKSTKESIWVRWSRLVMRYPWIFLLLGVIILTPFILLSTEADLGFNMVSNLPKGTEAREGFEILFEEFDLGELSPYTIIIDGKNTNSIFTEDIIESANQFGIWAMGFTKHRNGENLRFESISSLSVSTNHDSRTPITLNLTQITDKLNAPSIINLNETNEEKMQFIDTTSKYINYDFGNNTLLIELTSNLDAGSTAAFSLVHNIRDQLKISFAGLDVDTYVAGFSASFSDSKDQLFNDVPKMLAVAVILIFLALLIIFRSILLPIKAIITIGGSILFALGTLVYIFQDGHIQHIEIFDITLWEAEKSGISFIIPVFLFTTILGLGMDYSIFIISRIREEYEKGASMDDAVGIGLAKTAGVITSAATIMTVTFMVFALSPMVILKTMGFAMAIAIIADASISRIIILPAAMKLLGDWNWWLPDWLKKILPNIRLEH